MIFILKGYYIYRRFFSVIRFISIDIGDTSLYISFTFKKLLKRCGILRKSLFYCARIYQSEKTKGAFF